MSKLPCVYQDFDSEAQEYAYVVSENEIARWASLDLDAVNTEIKELDIDYDLLGIKDFEIPEIEVLEPQCDEDEVPEVKHDPVTKRGDVWLLGVYWQCEKCNIEYGEQKAKEMNYECPCDL